MELKFNYRLESIDVSANGIVGAKVNHTARKARSSVVTSTTYNYN